MMQAAILDATLWLCIRVTAPEWAFRHGPFCTKEGLVQHVMNLDEIQQVAAMFGEDVPTLLSKTFNVDLHGKWRELTEPCELMLN